MVSHAEADEDVGFVACRRRHAGQRASATFLTSLFISLGLLLGTVTAWPQVRGQMLDR